MKLIILASDSASTWMVVNTLRGKHSDLKVALEQPNSRFRLLLNRVRRQGVVKVLGQLLFMLYLPLLRLQSRSQTARLISDAGLSADRPSGLMVTDFESTNSDTCQDWLRRQMPDVVVVNGTRILSRNTLNSCSAVFFNTHCGITPAYRGVHGGYWALAAGDGAHAGVTIHVVDAGIDTGDIVYQQLIEIGPEDNFLTYPVRQYVVAILMLEAAIKDVQTGKLKVYRRDDLPSAVWYHPTLWQYIMNYFQRGVR